MKRGSRPFEGYLRKALSFFRPHGHLVIAHLVHHKKPAEQSRLLGANLPLPTRNEVVLPFSLKGDLAKPNQHPNRAKGITIDRTTLLVIKSLRVGIKYHARPLRTFEGVDAQPNS